MTLRNVLIAIAVLAIVFGLAYLLIPPAIMQLFGTHTDASGYLAARFFGRFRRLFFAISPKPSAPFGVFEFPFWGLYSYLTPDHSELERSQADKAVPRLARIIPRVTSLASQGGESW